MGRVVLPGEPWFLDEDVDDVLDYLAIEDANCPGCGQEKTVSFDKRTDGHWDVTRLKCHACAARALQSEDLKPSERAGAFFVVEHDGHFG